MKPTRFHIFTNTQWSNAALGICTLSLIFGIACGAPPWSIESPARDLPVATYGNEPLTVQDLLIAFQESHSFADMIEIKDLIKPVETLKKICGQIALERYLAALARERGLHNTPAFLEYHKNVVHDELAQKLMVDDIIRKIEIQEKDLRRYYDENRSAEYLKSDTNIFTVRGLYSLFQLHSREEARSRVEAALAKLKQGIPFENVAREYSDAPPESRGKEMAIAPGMANPSVEARLRERKNGEYTDIIENEKGYFIYQRVNFVEPAYLAYEQVKDQILQRLVDYRREQGILILSQTLLHKFKCVINEILLEQEHPDPSAKILSVPGVYDLTLKDFNRLAEEQKKTTAKSRQEYLTYLANKSAFLAEALSRGWTEAEVKPAVSYWDNKQLAKNLIESEMEKQSVTEKQIREFYEANPNRPEFMLPKRYHLYHLLFRTEYNPSLSKPEILIRFQKAERIAQLAFSELLAGRSFEETVAQFTGDESLSAVGGAMDTQQLNQMDPSIQAIVEKMDAGEISLPQEQFNLTKQRFGYEIFYVQDIEPEQPMRYEEAREVIGRKVAAGLFERFWNQGKEEFLKTHPEKISEEVISTVYRYLSALIKRPDHQVDVTRYEQPSPQKN